MPRETTSIVIKHTIPTLGVAIRPKLRITTSIIIKPIDPTFNITHSQFLSVRGLTSLSTCWPTVTSFSSIVCDTKPAFGHSFFSTKYPEATLRFWITYVNTTFNGWYCKFISIFTVIKKTSGSSAISSDVRKKSFSCISNYSVLLNTRWPNTISWC